MRRARYRLAACFVLTALARSFAAEELRSRSVAGPHPLPGALRRFEYSQVHMGTQFRIVLYAPDLPTADQASSVAFNRIAELDDIMSDYRPSSELMLLCQQAGGPPVKVSEDLFYVLSKSQELARRSDGAFDITVGPIVRLWRRARRQHQLPDPERLRQALDLVGYDKLRLDPKARTAHLLKPGILLDLGGIGKGYAADEALRVLKRYGIGSALVAGGGDIAASNPPPGKKGWIVGIAPLESSANGQDETEIQNLKSKIQNEKLPARYISLHDGGVSTSGDAEQHVEIGSIRYSHIVNPKTGLALTGRSSVTVLAPDGITADGLATAVSVLGPERGLELINSTPGTAALIVQATEHGTRLFESKFPLMASAAK